MILSVMRVDRSVIDLVESDSVLTWLDHGGGSRFQMVRDKFVDVLLNQLSIYHPCLFRQHVTGFLQ